MENFLEILINKDFKSDFFLHFISKNQLDFEEKWGNNDLWKTFI